MFAKRVLFCLSMLMPVALVSADEKDRKEPEKRGGTIVGEVTAKEKYWIEVKADGEEKARRYMPRWVGGLPKDGGGLDKKILEEIAKLKVGSRIKIEWEFDERPRVVKIQLVKEAPDKP
jgi:hypothetical protein